MKNEVPETLWLTVRIPTLSYKLSQQPLFWKKIWIQVIKDTPMTDAVRIRTENNFEISFLIWQNHLCIRKFMTAGTDSPHAVNRDWLTCWVTLSSLNIFLYSAEIVPNIIAHKQVAAMCFLPLQPAKVSQHLCMSQIPLDIKRLVICFHSLYWKVVAESHSSCHFFEVTQDSIFISIVVAVRWPLYNLPLHTMYPTSFKEMFVTHQAYHYTLIP